MIDARALLTREKAVKLLFIFGLTLSFWVILGVMALLHSRSPAVLPADGRRQADHPPDLPSTSPSAADRQVLQPDPEVVQQLTDLKQGLNLQLDHLKQHREAILAALAQGLAKLPPAEAAAALEALDDELAALALHRLGGHPRQEILRHLTPQRADPIERRLHRLTSR